jgi:HEAT repeat protein
MSGVPEASPALLILCRDYDPAVRAEAVRALGRVKDGTTIPAILEALKDPMPEVRVGAVESLGLLRDSRAIPALYAALKDENIQVGKKAQISLKQLTDITQLIAALDDESTLVRANAAYVLWLMTGQDNGTDKAKWDSWAAGKSSSSTPK